MLKRLGAQQEALFDRFLTALVEQAPRPSKPAAGLRPPGGTFEQDEGHPQGTACRTNRIPKVEIG